MLQTIDCEDPETRRDDKRKFKKCSTMEEFLSLWSLFYENKICIPGYYGSFIGATDNPEATFDLGKKFQFITKKGILVHSSQVTIPQKQKGYISAYVPNTIIRKLTKDLNMFNNIVAFNYALNEYEDQEGARDLFVTIKDGVNTTHVSELNKTTIYFIHKWMDIKLRRIFNTCDYGHLVIVNPSYESDPEYVIDVLCQTITKL